MRYNNIKKGMFLSRPNRFIALVDIDGKETVCHVKNTGRCKELLTNGATVLLEKSDNSLRKTQYDLVSVYKGDKLINMDSQAPNKLFGEWAETSGYFGNLTFIKPECTYKNSRFDYYLETEDRKIFVEVKGVTLEKDGVLMFPDAPTQRGIKHLNELAEAKSDGYEAFVFFVAQMKDCEYFTPNVETHPQFATALKNAQAQGVEVRCVNCDVAEGVITVDRFVEVVL